jgi:sulfoxide reductase heme-binding subunit YedZ
LIGEVVRNWSAASVDRFKPWLFALGMVPLVRWFWYGWTDQLTANPTEFLTRSSGTWTLVCLLVTLLISPLRELFNQPALIRVRRLCGLVTFFYASLHALAWAWWDQGFYLRFMWRDVLDRPFITVGVAGFFILAMLAATSSMLAMRKLGKHWKSLHRLIYLAIALGILHYWWHKAGKNDFSEVSVYAAIAVALLVWRLWRWLKPETKKVSAGPRV